MGEGEVLGELPFELVSMIAHHWTYDQCVAYDRDTAPVRTLVNSRIYWSRRPLRIADRTQLRKILRDGATRNATILDLHGAEVDDTDLHFIAHHFARIQRLDLGHNPDVTDEGVEGLVRLHGQQLRELRLTKLFRLTNVTLSHLQWHCRALRHLDLAGGMFTATAVRQMLMDASFRLESLSLSRCYLLDMREIPTCCEHLASLRSLDASHLDSLQPYQVQAVMVGCPQLERLDITGCHEFTLKAIRELSGLHPSVHIEHDARLEDHSIDSVRRFLLGLVHPV